MDGNSNNQYYGLSCTRTNEEQNPWWRVDLEQETEVFEVNVVNRGDCCGSRLYGFEIRVGMFDFFLAFSSSKGCSKSFDLFEKSLNNIFIRLNEKTARYCQFSIGNRNKFKRNYSKDEISYYF